MFGQAKCPVRPLKGFLQSRGAPNLAKTCMGSRPTGLLLKWNQGFMFNCKSRHGISTFETDFFFFLFQPLMQLFSYLFFTILVLTNSHKTNEHLCFSLCFSPSGENANGQWNAETCVVGERMNRSLHPGLLPVVKKSVNCWRTGAHSISLSRTEFVAWELSLPINYHFLLNLFGEIETCFKFYLCFFFNLGGNVKI